ncbi:MAG: diguanylate cyclase [bacterium]|nr:diguanylate cyclase [bacterium]
MDLRRINKILREFVKSNEWKQVRMAILSKIDSPGWVINKNGDFIYKVEQNRECCEMIKSTQTGKKICDEFFKEMFAKACIQKQSALLNCQAGFYGVVCPLTIEENIIGAVGGCQILVEHKDLTKFENTAKKLNINKERFLNLVKYGYSISSKVLEMEMNLIALLSQAAINVVLKEDYLLKANTNIKKLLELHKLIEEKREYILENKIESLYTLILEAMLEILKYRSSYLFFIDRRTKKLMNKLSNSVVDLRMNENLVGKLIVDNNPKLIEMPKPILFLNISLDSPQHCILALSHKEDETNIGDDDIEVSTLVRDYLSIVIKSVIFSFEKRKELEKRIVVEEKRESVKIRTELLRGHAQRASELRKYTENIKLLTEKISFGDVKLDEFKEQKEILKAQVEELGAVATELEIQAAKLKEQAEELEKKKKLLKEEDKKADELRAQIEKLKKQEEDLKKNAEELKRQAEEARELITQAEEIQELREKTNELNILYSISSDLASIDDPIGVLGYTLNKIKPYFDYQISSYLYLKDENDLIGRVNNLCYISEESLEEIKRKLYDRWKVLEVKDTKREVKFTIENPDLVSMAGKNHEKVNSHITTPLIERGKLIGLIHIASLEKDVYDASKIRLLSIIGSHISVAIEKIRLLAKAKELAEHDSLTGIYNLRYFEQFLVKEINYAREITGQLSIIMIDLDNLKKINDQYGHEWGNKYIQTVTFLLQNIIGKNDCLARIGGDEFVVALPGIDREEGVRIAQKIKDSISNYEFRFMGKIHKMSASVGVASFSKRFIYSNKDIMDRADKAMYQAKYRGKNQVCVFKEGAF